jgi:hypothetical protein
LPEVLFIPLGFSPHSVATILVAYTYNLEKQKTILSTARKHHLFQSEKNLLGLNRFCPQQISHTIRHHSRK